MNEEPDLTEVVDAVERLCRNYRKPLPGQEILAAAVSQPNEDMGKKDGEDWRTLPFSSGR